MTYDYVAQVPNGGCYPDLAFNRPATESSTYPTPVANGFVAANAVDGHSYSLGSEANHTCTSTDSNDLSPWWAVDLGKTTMVGYVFIRTRDNGTAVIRVGNGGDATSYLSTNQAYTAPLIDFSNGEIHFLVAVNAALVGRYVSVARPGGPQLALCAVQVYGMYCLVLNIIGSAFYHC